MSREQTGDIPGDAGTTGDRVRRIQRMKADLQAHYERFKALRAAGRNEEAVAQFNVTLKAAGDLLETSTRVLKEVALNAAAADPDPKSLPEGRVLHLPPKPHTH